MERLVEALKRISAMTPGAANAVDARALHLTVKAIADEALDHIPDAQGWRDIATAPRDGTRFVGYGRLNRKTEDGCEQSSAPVLHIMQYRSYGVGGDWISTCLGNTISQHPTHWMPLAPPPSAHPAPIKPSADTGELRERVALEIRNWPFDISRIEGCLELADAILDLIQSERAVPRVSILSTKFFGDNANGQPIFEGGADGVTNITLHGWTCFGPDEAGQKALAGFQSERAG